MDSLTISKLGINTIIGVYPHEKLAPQTLQLDLTLYFDASHAGMSDNLNHTIDYDNLTKELKICLEQQSFELIERVAHEVIKFCFCYPLISAISVTVHKPTALDIAENVAITLYREKQVAQN